jgi:hypothetical protein
MKRKRNKMRNKKEFVFMFTFPIFATIVSFLINANLLISSILFFGVPSVYLSFKKRESIKKTFIFSLISSIPFAIIIDYFASKDSSWYVPKTVFPIRLFGRLSIGGLIWLFLLAYFIIMFYEYFLDKKDNNKLNKNFKYFITVLLTILLLVFILHLVIPALNIPYFYLIFGILLVLFPIAYLAVKKPKLLPRQIPLGIYFFCVLLLHEITGIKLEQWTFPGKNFIGWVSLFGYSFPFEEFLFFIILTASSVITYYELFADDQK